MEIVKATQLRPVEPLSRTLPDLPKGIEALVHRLLEKDVVGRPSSASAVAAELEAFASAYGYRWSVDVTAEDIPGPAGRDPVAVDPRHG